MRVKRTVGLTAALFGAAITLSPMVGHAAFLQPFSGNWNGSIQAGPGSTTPALDGTLNFAVLNRTSGVAGDSFGTGFSGFNSTFVSGIGSAAFDSGAQFLYLYQVVNNGTTAFDAKGVSVQLTTVNGVTSYGFFVANAANALGFSDNAGAVSATNDFGNDTMNFTLPNSPAEVGVTNPGITTIADGKRPSMTGADFEVRLGADPFSPSLGLAFSAEFGGTSQIRPDERTTIVGFTSNLAPQFLLGAVRDSGLDPQGFTPSPGGTGTGLPGVVPEPGTLLLLGSALTGMSAYVRRRKKAGKV